MTLGDVKVVLASASPRRKELLQLLGLEPEVVPAHLDESVRDGEKPEAYVERVAREKAAAVHAKRKEALVVAADTTVVLDGEIIAKPESEADAVRMLKKLQGRDHVVHTAIAVAYRSDTASGVESTRVWMRKLDDAAIRAYVATGEPMDKAGAYGIQGFGAVIVERIAGDYFTVMGLGLARLVGLVKEVGVDYAFGELVLRS
jgi:septum formation protein